MNREVEGEGAVEGEEPQGMATPKMPPDEGAKPETAPKQERFKTVRLEGIAKRAQIAIGEMVLEAFRMPDGEYRLSQTGAGNSISKGRKSLGQFLQGKSPEAAQLKGLTFGQVSYDGHHIPTKTISIAEFTLYLRYWDKRGDAKAGAFVQALMQESLERRCDRKVEA